MDENINQQNNITTSEYSSSVSIVDPSTLFTDGYELSNSNVIESVEYIGQFIQDVNNIEFYIYDSNKTLIYSDYDFAGYTSVAVEDTEVLYDPKTGESPVLVTEINLQPERDISNEGFNNGEIYAVYNFINLELGSSLTVPYYLAEISSDRTEIRLKSNLISTREMKTTSLALEQNIKGGDTFDEIYISFGNNEYHIAVNIKYDDSFISTTSLADTKIKSTNAIGQASILLKLIDPLPPKYSLLDELYVATKTAETKAYLVNFVNDFFSEDNIIALKGPNSNLKLNDFVNTPGIPQNKNQLLATKSSGSKDQLLATLKNKGITLTPNYSTGSFNDFVNFSSAKARVSNFVEKVSRIQAYEADINTISQTTASNAGNIPVSESIASLWTKIENEIVAFDGFDYYQYYTTGSDAYPKTGTVFPLQLLATQSAAAQTWITATEASASAYDEDNQNWLYYTVPDFIKENTSNANYLEFVNMVGQSFDEVWLYTKAVTKKLNTTNDLEEGVPLSLADDMITSLGYTGFGNNYNNQDNFIGLIGNDNGSYVPPTGSQLINHYIAVNGSGGGIINYWDPGYTFEDYVQSFQNTGFPYPIDKVSKEIFKRLYHNMAYLVKKKGTVSGLRQLINIWGIPNTILRINEFGGKNKDEQDDYDLWYQRYSYAYKPVPEETNYASSSVRIPWQPLYRNYIDSHSRLIASDITAVGGPINNGAGSLSVTSAAAYGVDTSFTVTGGGSGGTLTLTCVNGDITKVTLIAGGSGYSRNSVVTITGAQVNALNDGNLLAGWSGTSTFPITSANLGAEQIVPDGLGFRFKTTGYPSSSFGGSYDSQSLFIKKSTNVAADADFGIALYYTGSTSGSYTGSTSNAYVDYGEMRFFIKGDANGGGTAMSPPIYLPFFDKGWWNVQLQRDQHPIVTNNNENTTYTLYVANKIYDGADGNQLGFQGSASIYVNINNGSPPAGGFPANVNSASLNKSWNDFSIDLAQYGAGAYLGGWGNTLANGTTGSIGTLSAGGTKGVNNAGKNFSGSLQEFRYYSHDISQSVFNDAVMNPESIEGNFITGSESSFDIVNFRAPLGNELENIFTSSVATQNIEVIKSVHPAITGSSPLLITASFWNPTFDPIAFPSTLTSSYDVTYNANSSTRTYSETNVETYFLDQPSIGIRNRVSNKIKYSTNLNFGTVLSNKVSIQQDPPISQSYTDNINSLEVAFSPTDEVNDDIIQALGYGSIQEVIADPRFRSSSADTYPGLDAIAKDYFKKYTNRNQIDYLRLIKFFDDSLFKAIKNYVPARTSVSTGIVVKQNMLERNRYREPQVDIVTTQSYSPTNNPLTAKNLELTGSITTHQLWDPALQKTYYSSSDVYTFSGGAGGSVNPYNIEEEGGGLFILENDDLDLTSTPKSIFDTAPLEVATRDIVLVDSGLASTAAAVSLTFNNNSTGIAIAPASGDSDLENRAITIISVNPAGGFITKKYVTSNDASSTGDLAGTSNQFVLYYAGGTGTQNSQQFLAAVNSANGQGSGAATPTLIVEQASANRVTLTQINGGTEGNTTISYGSQILSTIGRVSSAGGSLSLSAGGINYGNTQTYSDSATTNSSGTGTGLHATVTSNAGGNLTSISIGTTNKFTNWGYVVNNLFTIDDANAVGSAGFGKVETITPFFDSNPTAFVSGANVYGQFLNTPDKSVQTPVYIDYDFVAAGFASTAVTIQASSSKRGIVMTNTTTYTTENPVGSILEDSLFDIHPGEDMYMLISSVPDRTIEDYSLILGENITITTALAAETTTASPTLLIDNLTDDNVPVVGATVTGPDIKAGVVTVLGAITAAGSGYTNGAAQILPTTGAGGNNLTLNVTVVNGSLTTAAISGANNDGTGYTNGDIVTVIGGNNDAKVAITTATAKPTSVTAFDPTNNKVTFNTNQTVADNTKVTFTVPNVIPDKDTVPVSQQGYFVYNTMSLGVDTMWDGYQRQFYNGEYSGSNITVDFREQYNPYRKVKPNSLPVLDDTITVAAQAAYVSQSNTAGGAVAFFNPISSQNEFTYTTALLTGGDTTTLNFPISASIIPNQDYLLTFDITQTVNSSPGTNFAQFDPTSLVNNDSGIQIRVSSSINRKITPETNLGGNVTTISLLSSGRGYTTGTSVFTTTGAGDNNLTINTTVDADGNVTGGTITAAGTGYAVGDIVTLVGGFSGVPFSTVAQFTITAATAQPFGLNVISATAVPISASFTGANFNTTYRNDNQFVPLSFTATAGVAGVVSNIKVVGVGGEYGKVKAPIFLTQQDQGYDNQADHDNMGNEDAQGNIITPIHLIENTESVILNNSDYNPLSNNANINRSSSHRFVLSYGSDQTTPQNFLQVVTSSYYPTSISGSFPEKADVPDSNYTMQSSVNSRYAGAKLTSLTYNFFTPSGSVGVNTQLTIQPVNSEINQEGEKVAKKFLDNSVTSSFEEKGLGQGNPSWRGDDRQYSGLATIDKHPIYMARFESSYEQLNLYGSYQFNIDQLIQIPFEDITGQEVTPNSIIIDGSNENKKVVSSVFEKKRQASVTYLNPKTRTIDYTTMQVGNYCITSGATNFLTINSNAKSRVSSSLAYEYTLGGEPPTGSRAQLADTIQMVTASIVEADTELTGVLKLQAFTATAPFPTSNATGQGVVTITDIPLNSIGGGGSGALATVVFADNGTYTSTTITNGGQGYQAGDILQIPNQTMIDAVTNAGFSDPEGRPISIKPPLNFTVLAASLQSVSNITSVTNGFLLSGSLTTDQDFGGLSQANVLNTASIGDLAHPMNGSQLPTDYLPISYNATPVGSYTNLETITSGPGTGMTLDFTVAAEVPNLITATTLGTVFPDGVDVIYETGNTTGTGVGMTVKLTVASNVPVPLTDSNGVEYFEIANPGSGYTVGSQYFITSPGGGTNAAGVVANSQTAVSAVTINNPGIDYSIGDTVSVTPTTMVVAGMIPTAGTGAPNYTTKVFSSSDIQSITGQYFVNFNPSPISSSEASSIFTQPTVPETQQLLIGGPQLAVHHMYNTTVSASLFAVNTNELGTGPVGTSTGPLTRLWTTSGSIASDPENYMVWNPDGSDCSSYQNTNTPFLIQRGDVIRVEGLKNTINDANVSQSTAFIENFTVEEIQDYFYTSSFSEDAQNLGGLQMSFVTPGTIPPPVQYIQGCSGQGGSVTFSATIGTQDITTDGNGSGGTITFVTSVGANCPGIVSFTITGGSGYAIGDKITIGKTAGLDSNNYSGGSAPVGAQYVIIIVQVTNSDIIDSRFNNDFTIGVDTGATTANSPVSGSQTGYHLYEKGEVGFTAPTFVKVSPDPVETLNGINNGEITKFTIRRQIEDETSVYLKGITPPSGSLGVKTPSGQGFLLPRDLSPIQKSNALNIINQLKAKNAFDKPIEPGVTRS